jgi:hypothetical protein
MPSSVPTMVSDGELTYLRQLTASYWNGQDDILEVGPWLGATTVALASGMAEADNDGGHLHVLDTFIWRQFMGDRAQLELAEGESFRPAFEANVALWEPRIVVHEARLPDDRESDFEFETPVLEYEARLPIFEGRWLDRDLAILFIDGAKSWTGLGHLLSETIDRMVPGRSVIVAQDYRYWAAYWVPMGLELVEGLIIQPSPPENSNSFLVSRPEMSPWPRSAYDVDGLELLRSAAARLQRHGDDHGAAIVRLGEIPYRANQGDVSGAVEAYLRLERGWGTWPAENIRRARSWLARRTTVPVTRRWRAIQLVDGARRVGRRLPPLT